MVESFALVFSACRLWHHDHTRRFSEKTALILLVRRWWLDLIFFLDGGMSFHITGSRLHFDNCTFNGPTVAMKASPPEPPTVVSDADQPQATAARPNWAFEKAASVMNQLLVLDFAQHPEATNNRPVSMPTPKAMPAALVARELARRDRDRSFLVARGLDVPADVEARILAQLDQDRRRLAYASPKAGSISPGRCGTCQTCTDSNCAQPPSRPPSSEMSCAADATEWMHSAVAGRGSSSKSIGGGYSRMEY